MNKYLNKIMMIGCGIIVAVVVLFSVNAAVTTVTNRNYEPTNWSGYATSYYRDTFKFDSITRYKPFYLGCKIHDFRITNISTSADSLWFKFNNMATFASDTVQLPYRLLYDSNANFTGVATETLKLRSRANGTTITALVEGYKVD